MKDYRDINLNLIRKNIWFLGKKKNLLISQTKFIMPIFEANIYN